MNHRIFINFCFFGKNHNLICNQTVETFIKRIKLLTLGLMISFTLKAQPSVDRRYIGNAVGEIPDEEYCDQPYVVIAKNGDWVCVLTTGPGKESQKGQHIVASISSDKGVTWSPLIDIEPSGEIPSSWATPYVTESGRIYVFYDYNGDTVKTFPNGKPVGHDTELGWYCYKYSDDNGRTWSKRYRLPMKKTTIDYINPWNGEVQLFWGVSKPVTLGKSIFFAYTKMGMHPQDLGEGWFYKCDNINKEKNPEKLHWEQLPDGNTGLSETTLGITQEEFNIVPLGNDDLYCIFRTNEGYPAESYSRDGGHTWSRPVFARDRNGKAIKTPRACPRLFKCNNDHYLLWYHNNNMKGYKGLRNPAWMLGGIEKDGKILWGQPEILLYGDEQDRISYPDLIEENGQFWITETQKSIARIHSIDPVLLNKLWRQGIDREISTKELAWQKKNIHHKKSYPSPHLPGLKNGAFTIEILADVKGLIPGSTLLDNTDSAENGLRIHITPERTVELYLKDDNAVSSWDTDPGTVKTGLQHIVFVVDGLANIITVIVNGKLCDGGRYRVKGWTWFDPAIDDVNGKGKMVILPAFDGVIKKIRIYNRYLLTSEVISNYYAETERSEP